MTNDSVTVALMRKIGLIDIAIADANFDHVSQIRVYQPGDIPERKGSGRLAPHNCSPQGWHCHSFCAPQAALLWNRWQLWRGIRTRTY